MSTSSPTPTRPTIVDEEFQDTEDLDGLFSGFDPETRALRPDVAGSTRPREDRRGGERRRAGGRGRRAGRRTSRAPGGTSESHGSGGAPVSCKGCRDETLQHPRCVFQILKRHFARYTPEMVQEVCGIPPEQFRQVADALTEQQRTGAHHRVLLRRRLDPPQRRRADHPHRARSCSCCSATSAGPAAASWRCAATPASRARPTSRRCSTSCPATCRCRTRRCTRASTSTSSDDEGKAGFWGNMRSYAVSLLKAYWGDAATAGERLLLRLPAAASPATTRRTTPSRRQIEGRCKGYFLVGENPAVGSANGKMQRLGMANLDWLVVRDLQMIESATFWKDGPEIETGELVTDEIGTEVFFLPAASHVEKAGTFTQTQRMLQWRDKAVDPPGDARSELQFYYELGQRIREKLAGLDRRDGPAAARPRLGLPARRATAGAERRGGAARDQRHRPGRRGAVGVHRAQGRRLDHAAAAGSTAACTPTRSTRPRRRKPHWEQDRVAAEWGWVWPAEPPDPLQPGVGRPRRQRRGASARSTSGGTPSSGQVDRRRRAGLHRRPAAATTCPRRARRGRTRSADSDPFVMQTDGKAWLFAPAGVADGPMPTHYEPPESPVRNPLYAPAEQPVAAQRSTRAPTRSTRSCSEVFPYVFTTYRLTEHHTAGAMSRTLPYLAELQPELFCEVSPRLARRARARATAAGRRSSPPAPRSRRGCWSPTGCGRCGSATGSSSRSGCPTTGAATGITHRRLGQRPGQRHHGPQRLHPGQGRDLRHPPGPPSARARPHGVRRGVPSARRESTRTDPAPRRSRLDGAARCRAGSTTSPSDAGYDRTTRRGWASSPTPRVCIGCKACEVACKEWNEVPDDGYLLTGMSYDNTQALGASTWRHVAFVEKPRPTRPTTDLGPAGHGPARLGTHESGCRTARTRRHRAATAAIRWLMSSDVCKHCTHAGLPRRLPDRRAVPHRVRHRRRAARHLQRLRLLRARPARTASSTCARRTAGRSSARCATTGSRTGQTPGVRTGLPDPVDPVRRARRAARAGRPPARASCTSKGVDVARLYGRDPDDGVGGDGAFFLLLDEPEVYGLPPDPVVTTRDIALDVEARRRRRRHAGRSSGVASFVGTAPMREQLDGPRAGVRVLLRPADHQDADLEDPRRPALPVPRRAGRRLGVLAEGAALAGLPHLERVTRARRGGRCRRSARWPWSTTSAGPSGSSTCCGCSSRRRRCRSGSFILAPFAALSVGGRRARRSPGWLPRLGRLAGRRRRGVRAAARRRTPRRWSPTPPCRPGTRRTASCRSCSPARAPRPAGGLAMVLVRRSQSRSRAPDGAGRRRARAGRWPSDVEPGSGMRRPSPTTQGRAGRLMKAARALTLGGAALSRWSAGAPGSLRAVAGAAYVAGSLRHPVRRLRGRPAASARDPKYTVVPQRERMAARARTAQDAARA